MLKLKELKEGDYILAEYDGQKTEGVVRELHRDDENEVCVETSVQQFWFKPEDLSGILLNEEQLLKLGFQRQEMGEGVVKYLHNAFRVLVVNGDFSNLEIWYREDHRKLTSAIYVHEFQHHYSQMTKVNLVRERDTV